MPSVQVTAAAWRMLDVMRAEVRTTDESDDTLIGIELNALLDEYGPEVCGAASQVLLNVWRRGMGNLRAHGVSVSPDRLVTDLDRVIRLYETARSSGGEVDAALTALRAFQDCVGDGDVDVIGRAQRMGLAGADLAWGMHETVRTALALTVADIEQASGMEQADAEDALFAGLRGVAEQVLGPEPV